MPFYREILGQDSAIQMLRREIRQDRAVQAYIFEGQAGSGRLSLARAFAAAALCVGPESKAYQMFSSGSHPDYLELPRAPRELTIRRFIERPGAGASKEKIDHQPALEFLSRRPMAGELVVLVIPDAERLRPESANALLKTVEEPPAYAMIIFTTVARDRLLPTIVSRCRRIAVAPLAAAVIAAAIQERCGVAAGEAAALALTAEGSLGMALAMAGGEAAESWRWIQESYAELTPASAVRFAGGMVERARSAAGDGQGQRQAALRLLDMAALHIRKELRAGRSNLGCAKALEALLEAAAEIAANVRLELVLHSAALETFAALRYG